VPRDVTDLPIRIALRSALEARHGREALILNELQLEHSRAFADVATINGRLEIYEIKSDADRLDRLASQAGWYAPVCDSATLVAAQRHIHRAEAEERVPPWWGLVAAIIVDGRVVLEERRAAGDNPGSDVRAVLNLLRKAELLKILLVRGRDEPVWHYDKRGAIDEVHKLLGAQDAHATALRVLRYRKTWTARQLGVATEDERLAHARRQVAPLICMAANQT
jgi:hypothetical protein